MKLNRIMPSMVLLLGLSFLGFWLGQTQKVSAIEIGAGNTPDKALSVAPDGIYFGGTDLFKLAQFPAVSGQASNGGEIIHDADRQVSAIKITDATSNQLGAIWSNPTENNYVDATKKQTMTMWIYTSFESAGNGDGMAFVLQNDPNGVNAISQNSKKIAQAGQTLGVWASDMDYTVTNAGSALLNTAIQNSWAIEFDTYANMSQPTYSSLGNGIVNGSYDLGSGARDGQAHIADAFPASPSTYTQQSSAGGFLNLSKRYYYSMKHNNFDQLDYGDNSLTGGEWTHLTVSWDPVTYEISYNFGDKDNKTGEPLPGRGVKKEKLTKDAFGAGDGGTKALWGFTGSTGASKELNMVIFESIPSMVQASAKASIVNLSDGNRVLTATDNKVNAGNQLSFNYDLTYEDGRVLWKDNEANIDLPTDVNYTGGQIVYTNTVTGNTATEVMGAADLNAAATAGTSYKKLVQDLGSAAGDNFNTASIQLFGTAVNTSTADIDVASTHASFNGSTNVTDTELQDFIIQPQSLKITSDDTDLTVDRGKDVTVTGLASRTDSSAIDNTTTRVYATLNGKDLGSTGLNSSDPAGQFQIQIPAADLLPKDNTLTYYVVDGAGNISNILTTTIYVQGYLYVNAAKEVSFAKSQTNSFTQLIKRNNDWNVTVSDSRGLDSKWTLQVQETQKLHGQNTGKDLAGGMVYVDPAGQVFDLTSPRAISSGTTDTDDVQQTVVTNAWGDTNGILLNAKADTVADHYKGQLTWNFVSSL